MKAYLPLLAIGLLLIPCCNPKEEPLPTPITVEDSYLSAKNAFHQYRLITDALGLEPRDSDGILCFTFETDPSFTSFSYPAPVLDSPTPDLSASTESVPAGTVKTPFHLEFPMSVGQTLPAEILDVESIAVGGQFQFTLTLDPDFPFSKAVVEEAVIKLPAWVEEDYPFFISGHQMEWLFAPETLRPGQVKTFTVWCANNYSLQEGEGILEPGHRLVLDGTISIDGILSVDENDRKDPGEASSPWSASWLFHWDEGCSIRTVTGRMDFSRKLADRTLTFSEVPTFLQDSQTALDLDDLHGKLRIQNRSSLPFAVNGDFFGNDRKYPFETPVVGPEESLLALISEKGGRQGDNPDYRSCDVPIAGFSGLISANPVSFAVKDIRITNDPETPCTFVFDQQNEIIVQAEIDSPLFIGKDFRVRHPLEVSLLMTPLDQVTRLTGTFSAENTLPFDYEIWPVFLDLFHQVVPVEVQAQPLRLPAGSPDSPRTAQFSFDWTVQADIKYVVLEFIGTTGKNRQGEVLHQDQHLAVKDFNLNIY